jgi:threonine/homoserine/homoserine lactone efflux protein
MFSSLIDPPLYLAYVGAVVLLTLMPGPNVALIVANSVAYGARYGLLTVVGTSAAIVLQLILTAIGLSELLDTLGHWFEWLRWIGVAYLLYLGISAWRAPATDLGAIWPQPLAARRMLARALVVSLSNPKTLLFYGAFFPQFIDPARPILPQVALLSVSFVVIAVLVDSCWALAAGKARHLLGMHGKWRNRLSGGLLLGAGISLALVRRP